MIRINLLPVKKAKKRATGQRQAILMIAVVAVELVGIVGYHMNESLNIEEKTRRNNDAKQAIAKLKAEVGDYETIKAQRDRLIKQRDAITKLQSGRTGPLLVLREMSEILTKDKGPTYSKEEYENRLRNDPNAGYNPSWDPRRVTIWGWRETWRRVTIDGAGKSNEDVAEFLKRLKISSYFDGVWLQGTHQAWGGPSVGQYYTFRIFAAVKY